MVNVAKYICIAIIGIYAAVFAGHTFYAFSGICTNTVFAGILIAAGYTLILAANGCIRGFTVGAAQTLDAFSRQRIAYQPMTILRAVRTMAQAIILHRRNWRFYISRSAARLASG
jgi:hypothetical protein